MTLKEAIKIIKEAPLFSNTEWHYANKLHEAIEILNEFVEKAESKEIAIT